jgi:hypothetical protein
MFLSLMRYGINTLKENSFRKKKIPYSYLLNMSLLGATGKHTSINAFGCRTTPVRTGFILLNDLFKISHANA